MQTFHADENDYESVQRGHVMGKHSESKEILVETSNGHNSYGRSLSSKEKQLAEKEVVFSDITESVPEQLDDSDDAPVLTAVL